MKQSAVKQSAVKQSRDFGVMGRRAANTRLTRIEARSLRIHPTAQREILPHKLKQLTTEMDLDAIGVLHAVEYEIDGVRGLWVIDGQHRLRALLELGLGEWEVEVKVHLDVKDDARASDLFLKLQNRANVNSFAKFDQAYKAKYKYAVRIVEIAAAHELKIRRRTDDGVMSCVSSLTRVYGFDDGATLEATLETIIEAWGHTAAAVEGKLIEGLGIVYKTYNGGIDRPVLVKKLAKYPGGASGLIGDAKGLKRYRTISLPRCVGEQIVEMYNSGRRAGKLDPL